MIKLPLNDTERYANAQKSFKGHIGDTVTVLCRAKNFEAGWQAPWASPHMDEYINQQARIIKINENGICLRKDDDTNYPTFQGGWYFPYFVISICR